MGISEHTRIDLARREEGDQAEILLTIYQLAAAKYRHKSKRAVFNLPDGEDNIGGIQFPPSGFQVCVGQHSEVMRHPYETRNSVIREQGIIFPRSFSVSASL